MIEFDFLREVVRISIDAGYGIMDVYESPDILEAKSDGSRLTMADKNAHNLICGRLQKLSGSIPILSEESAPLDIQDRLRWKRFWLVDPLDGTKEFIKRNGEFTVNIALISDGEPILGVVYAPGLATLWYGPLNHASFKYVISPDNKYNSLSYNIFLDIYSTVIGFCRL